MYQRILVAVDGSSTADLALDEAIRLAVDQKAVLGLVTAVDQSVLVLETPYAMPEFIDAARKSAEAVLEKAAARAAQAGLEVERRLTGLESFTQRSAELINAEAAAWNADLLVIGTHGRRGFNHLLLGSVAEAVIRTSTVPVLLIRGH